MSRPLPLPAPVDLERWERRCEDWIETRLAGADAAHDFGHVLRVVRWARRLGDSEDADLAVLLPAAWLHDCEPTPKDSPDRHLASRRGAETAVRFLREEGFPSSKLGDIAHAIEAHSFSAGIPPNTVEARVLRDADRLDAIGAIGIARCLMLGGELGRPLVHPSDPFARDRDFDDALWTLDHFGAKLLRLETGFLTEAGRREAKHRTEILQRFLRDLETELDG